MERRKGQLLSRLSLKSKEKERSPNGGAPFCIPKTTRWASGSKEAYADEEE